jgi:hypothetical protein
MVFPAGNDEPVTVTVVPGTPEDGLVAIVGEAAVADATGTRRATRLSATAILLARERALVRVAVGTGDGS